MRIIIQRVKQASVSVQENTISRIEHGLLAYIGLGHGDDLCIGKRMIDKLLGYRVFEDDSGKMGINVQQAQGGILLVSQFTLLANTAKGLRPDFKPAMAFDKASLLFAEMVGYAQQQYPLVVTGEFGADMQVHSINDGPINFVLEID